MHTRKPEVGAKRERGLEAAEASPSPAFSSLDEIRPDVYTFILLFLVKERGIRRRKKGRLLAFVTRRVTLFSSLPC